MNSDLLGRWFSLAANVAVFVGLLLVAYEINQAQVQMELSALADGADNFTQAMESLSQDEDLAKLIYRAETDFDGLSDFERWRLFKYLDGYMIMSEQDFHVITQSRVSASGFEYDWRKNMSMHMYQAYWSQSASRFGSEFQGFIERIVAQEDELVMDPELIVSIPFLGWREAV